jgi:DNA invertase Pin-like site-specific DNA recombinase
MTDSTRQFPQIQIWAIDRLVYYARNPRKKDTAIDRMCASIREFGFKIPVLARSDGTVVCGQLITVNYASGRRSITERNQDRRLVRGARRLWRDGVGESAGTVRDGSAPERRAAILIERLDRLARELFIQEYILRDLKQRGVTLISAAEPDLDSDPGRVLFRQMMGAIAQYDRTMIVLKLRAAGKRQKAATGRREGRKPCGDRPGERAIIDGIQAPRAAWQPYDAIAGILNAEGVPTRTPSARWFGSTVRPRP